MKFVKKNIKWAYLAIAVWNVVDMFGAHTLTLKLEYGSCWIMMCLCFGIQNYIEKKEKEEANK